MRSSSADSLSSSSRATSTRAKESYANSASGVPRQSASASRSVRAATSACPAARAARPVVQQRLETVQIELAWRNPQQVAVPSRQQDAVVGVAAVPRHGLVFEQPAQPRDQRVDAPRRTRRRRLGPQRVDDLLDGNDLVRAQEQEREECAPLPPSERQLTAIASDLQRPENPELHSSPIGRTTNLAPRLPRL